MLKLGLSKSFPLDNAAIDEAIKLKAAGSFALGVTEDSGQFTAKYIGWAASDLKNDLKEMIDPRYSAFKYGYTLTARDAFEKSCRIFHDLGGKILLDNKEHPARPVRAKWQCPVCDIFQFSAKE